MRRIVLPSLLAVAALSLALFAQNQAGTAQPAQATTRVQTYSGSNVDGNVQLALNDALLKAQQALSKTTADAQFKWQLDTISGTRGGITGSQACTVVIHIVP